jgi:hypothetical protein
MYNSESYYDKVDRILDPSNSDDNEFENLISIYKFNPRIINKFKKRQQEELTPEYLHTKLKEDMPKLERFFQDKEYRNELLTSDYNSYEHYQLTDLFGLEKIVKEKLGIPVNSIIRYERIKCSKHCNHKSHQYFYTYFWDSNLRKLKKKYIGKKLPFPFSFKLSLVR